MALPRSGNSDTRRYKDLTCCNRCGNKGWKRNMSGDGICGHCVNASRPGLTPNAQTRRQIKALQAKCDELRRKERISIRRMKEFAIADARDTHARIEREAREAAQKAAELENETRDALFQVQWSIEHDFAPEMRRAEEDLESHICKRFDDAMAQIRRDQVSRPQSPQSKRKPRKQAVESDAFYVFAEVQYPPTCTVYTYNYTHICTVPSEVEWPVLPPATVSRRN